MFGSLVNPQTLNRYAYTLNNPLKYVDPTGHDASESDDPYDDKLKTKEHSSPSITLEFNAEAAAAVEGGIGSYADWGLGPVMTEMIDTWAEPMLEVVSSPLPSTVAYQMLAGVTDAVDPIGAILQRAVESITGLSSGVDRSSLGYRSGNELIGPMLVTGVSIGAGGFAGAGRAAVSADGYDLAIGLVDQLPGLVEDMNAVGLRATTYVEQAGTAEFIPERFMQIAGRARSIHLTGEGFNFAGYVRWAAKGAQLTVESRYAQGTVTNWETFQSLANWAGKFVLH